jgi:hypothetical protein
MQTTPEMELYVKQAADNAVKQVFAILGVDVDKPAEVEDFRANLRFGAGVRKAADRGVITVLGIMFTALGYAAWSGFVEKVIKGH